MKKLFISLLMVLPFLFSCQPQLEPYTPGEEDVSGCYGVYFPAQAATGSHALDPTMAPEATFTAMRKNTSGAITVPLTVKTSADGVFNVGQLSFADGQSESTFTVTFPNSELGTTYSMSVSIDDPQYASKYQDQPIAFDYSMMRVEWKYILNPKTGEPAVFTFTQNWWGEIAKAYIKYYEVNNVRTCYTETFYHEYNGAAYEGYGFFGTNESPETAVEWQFIWYPKETNDDGQFIRLPSQPTGYFHSTYAADVWVYDELGLMNDLQGGSYDFLTLARNGEIPVSYYDGNGGIYFWVSYYYMAGIGGWSQGAYDVVGIGEGFTRVDYSIEAASDYSHNGYVPVYLTLGVDVAEVKYAVYPGTLSAPQIESHSAAIAAGEEESASIKEFVDGDEVKYADFHLELEETGIYTLIAVSFDASGNSQLASSVILNYVSADDEETYKVVVDCNTEAVPERYKGYDPKSSFAYYVVGENLTDAHVAIYKMNTFNSQNDAVLNDIKTNHAVDEATLAQINANGGWFTVADGLDADTEYIVLVWATNGTEEAFVSDTWTTDPLPYVWKELGKGWLVDDVACSLYEIDPIMVPCDVYEEETHPGLYKISGYQAPLVAAAFMEEGDDYEEVLADVIANYENIYWRNTSLIVDAQNPADVRIALQDYGVCFSTSDGFIDGITSVYKGEPFSVGVLEEGVISFPTENGMLCTLNGDGYYYADANGAFQIILPNTNAEPEPGTEAVAPASGKKSLHADKKLFSTNQVSLEREVKSVSFTSTPISHKYPQKPTAAPQKLISK